MPWGGPVPVSQKQREEALHLRFVSHPCVYISAVFNFLAHSIISNISDNIRGKKETDLIFVYQRCYCIQHIHIYTQIFIYIYIYVYTYIHIYTPTYLFLHVHIYTHAYIHTYIYINIYTFIYTYIYICMHTYIYIHIYGGVLVV